MSTAIRNKEEALNPLEIAHMPVAIYHYLGPIKPWIPNCKQTNCYLFQKQWKKLSPIPLEWESAFPKLTIKQKLKNIIRDFKNKKTMESIN